MALKRYIFYLILISIIYSSCTLQKRSYRKGYYIHWNSSDSKRANPFIKITPQLIFAPETEVTSFIHSREEEPLLALNSKDIIIGVKRQSKDSAKIFDCGDSLTFKSGTVSRVKVIEVTETEVVYKRCANLNGPIITVNKNDVRKIKYSSGNTVTFEIVKNNDLKKIATGKSKFSKDIISIVSLVFAFLFLFSLVLFSLGIIIGLEALYFLGLVLGFIFFLLAFLIALFSLFKIKSDPENYTGKSKAKMALFIIFFGALVAIPLLVIYFKTIY